MVDMGAGLHLEGQLHQALVRRWIALTPPPPEGAASTGTRRPASSSRAGPKNIMGRQRLAPTSSSLEKNLEGGEKLGTVVIFFVVL